MLDAVRRRRRIRRETILQTRRGGYVFHYPALSIIGQAIADGTSWQRPLGPMLSALFDRQATPLIIEVGANIGASLIEIKQVLPDANVVCFEPASRFADLLERNVAENDIAGVRVERFLVGDDDRVHQLFVNASTASVVTAAYGGHDRIGSEAIRMVKLDSYVGDSTAIDLLMIDTDGFDQAVVSGARRLLQAHGPVIYCEFAPFLLEEAGGSGHEFLKLLQQLGYGTMFPVVSGGQRLAAPLDHDGLLAAADRERYIDIVAIHDRRPEQARALTRLVQAESAPEARES
jgi:FkbM family methyltransferase